MNSWQHKTLAAGRWGELSLAEQMANIGAEVGRAINWRKKGDEEYALQAFNRALELMALMIKFNNIPYRYKELSRLKEVWCDYFVGDNKYRSTEEQWDNYFMPFAMKARRQVGTTP